MKTPFLYLSAALAMLSCSSPSPETHLPSSGKTMTGILYRIYDTELTSQQEQWENAIEKRSFERPFWNEQRTRAIAYMRLRESDEVVIHQFYYYRLNKEGWMELYGMSELISDQYLMANNITVGDENFLISFWDSTDLGRLSVTFGYPLADKHTTMHLMKTKDDSEMVKVFNASKIRFPELNPSKP